jgi:hypothetical protein
MANRLAILRVREESTVQLGQHRPDEPLFMKEFHENLESQSHNCPFGYPQLQSESRLGNSSQTQIWIPLASK